MPGSLASLGQSANWQLVETRLAALVTIPTIRRRLRAAESVIITQTFGALAPGQTGQSEILPRARSR